MTARAQSHARADKAFGVMRAFGLPDASVSAVTNPSVGALQEAVATLLSMPLTARDSEIVAAWLGAFHHHWPKAFARVLGASGAALQSRCPPGEPNRYLKLRRIALANLARHF
jgi:hypothetical protein